MEEKQITTALRIVTEGIMTANKRGAFELQESVSLYNALVSLSKSVDELLKNPDDDPGDTTE